MKTLTLNLAPELEVRLAQLAQRDGRSETEIVLAALEAYTTQPPVPDWVGVGASSGQLSERDEEILQAEWR